MRALRCVIRAGVALLALSLATTALADNPSSSPVGERLKVAVLPPHVTVLKAGFSTPKPADEWTAAATMTVTSAFDEALNRSARLERVEVPEWTPTEQAAIDEYFAVASALFWQLRVNAQWGTAGPKPGRVDRNLGTSLKFVADRTGVDYALGFIAVQAEQSGALAATTLVGAAAIALQPYVLVLPAHTVSVAGAFIVDLGSGEIVWFNRSTGHEWVGYDFTDLRDGKSAAKVVDELLAPYPETPALKGRNGVKSVPALSGLEDRATVSGRGGVGVNVPRDWYVHDSRLDVITATRDGDLLGQMKVELRAHYSAFSKSSGRSSRDSTPAELAELFRRELETSDLRELQIMDTALDATLAGQPAFRMRFTSRRNEWPGETVELEVVGTATKDGLLTAQLSAPHLHYFDATLDAFRESLGSVRALNRGYARDNRSAPH